MCSSCCLLQLLTPTMLCREQPPPPPSIVKRELLQVCLDACRMDAHKQASWRICWSAVKCSNCEEDTRPVICSTARRAAGFLLLIAGLSVQDTTQKWEAIRRHDLSKDDRAPLVSSVLQQVCCTQPLSRSDVDSTSCPETRMCESCMLALLTPAAVPRS